jgi:hypothetical protein
MMSGSAVGMLVVKAGYHDEVARLTAALERDRGIGPGNCGLDFSIGGRTGSSCVDFAMLGANGRIVQ